MPLPRTRLLTAAAVTCILSSIGFMIAVSLNPGTWLPPELVMPAFGPPWEVPSLRIPIAVVTVGLWLSAAVGGAGVAAGLAAIRHGARVSPRLLLGTGLAAVAILAVLPPAGSTDILDYATFGHIVTLGHTPYVWAPYHLRMPGNPFGHFVPIEWDKHVTLYGPLATFEQYLAAVLGGSSVARIVFWLKLWNAIAFAVVALVTDRMLRADPAARLRAHLLWTANPLLLWGLIAAGHIDMIAAGAGTLGLLLLGPARRGTPSLSRALTAGLLLGIAADIKIPYLVFIAGAVWALRRSPRALFATAGTALALLVSTYAWYGPPAIVAVLSRTTKVTADNFYQLFSTPTGFVITHLLAFSLSLVAILAVLALWRLPHASPQHPVLRPVIALSLAWLFVWPYQLPWYDVMVVCLLLLVPASRLDGLILVRLTAATIALMPGNPWLQAGHLIGSVNERILTFWTPAVLLGCVAALAYFCATARWRIDADASGDIAIAASTTKSASPVRM